MHNKLSLLRIVFEKVQIKARTAFFALRNKNMQTTGTNGNLDSDEDERSVMTNLYRKQTEPLPINSIFLTDLTWNSYLSLSPNTSGVSSSGDRLSAFLKHSLALSFSPW